MMRVDSRSISGRLLLGILACSVLLTGCGDKNGSKHSDDGRSYGGTIEGAVKEVVHTAFFDVTVDQAEQNEVFAFQDGLYRAEEGNTYLAVELTITNTYEKDLPMSITDFTLDYEGNTSEDPLIGYGRSELLQEQYLENEFTLKQGESISGSILFQVKKMDSYTLRYQEYYEDGFHGDTMEISFTPGVREVMDEEAGKAGQDQNTEAGGQETGADEQEGGDAAGADEQESGDAAGADAQKSGDAAGADAQEAGAEDVSQDASPEAGEQ